MAQKGYVIVLVCMGFVGNVVRVAEVKQSLKSVSSFYVSKYSCF